MDIHAQAWALRERGMRLGDIAKELHIELRDVAQLLSDKDTRPRHIPKPAPPKPAGDAQDAALRRQLEVKQAQIDALTTKLAEAEQRASAQAAKIRDLKAATTSGDALRLKAIADLLACRPSEIEQALDTLTATLADESALREHLQATVARLESRIDARDDDNIKLMARLGDLARLLGCGPDIEQTVSDLMSSLAEEIERRERLQAQLDKTERLVAAERARRQDVQARSTSVIASARVLAKSICALTTPPPDEDSPMWSDWMSPSTCAASLGRAPSCISSAAHGHIKTVAGRALQVRRDLTVEERQQWPYSKYLVRYQLKSEEVEG